MTSHSNANTDRHLVDEFEASFKACLSTLVAPETVHVHDQMELKTSVDQSMQRFLELAKETENFFLQRQMLLATTKPDNVIKEEIEELKTELSRKNALLQKQQTKVNNWLSILQSLECGGPPQPQHLHHGQLPQQQQQQQQQQQLARGTMSMPMGMAAGGMQQQEFQSQQQQQQQHHGVVGVASVAGSGDATPISIATTPLSGPLAHLEQATSSIGGIGYDRR